MNAELAPPVAHCVACRRTGMSPHSTIVRRDMTSAGADDCTTTSLIAPPR
ncbi:putative biotin biosynthesis protein BioC [Mycobacterium xenopi 3993]|nr:putative biotin biosynthesis protein BioC [Mycobacterium xenopi 3993]